MTVSHVLPMTSQGFTKGQQRRLLQLFDALEDFAFGIGGFQRDVVVVQQVAEQAR